MSNEREPAPRATAEQRKPKWWCNFCNLATDDQEAYLKHSCQEELKKQGKTIPAGSKNECS